jgi:ATP-dependent protease ClpP protease subunit
MGTRRRLTPEGSRADQPEAAPIVNEKVVEQVVPAPTKTPLYQAYNAPRYQRQAVIKQIQEMTGRLLICYVSGKQAAIERDDTIAFVDLLHNIQPNCDLDLLLHTGGGDIDAAEKLNSIVRAKVGTGTLRVIVPDYAKSAGTLIALGADRIVMSETSELGPIDPQIMLSDGSGNRISTPVLSYIEAFRIHSTALAANPNDVVAQVMLSKFDPARLVLFEAAVDRARLFAENQLKRGMFRNEGNWSAAARTLLDPTRWQSHGQVISWRDAADPEIGLTVEYIEPESEIWQRYWELYTLQRLAIKDQQKLFESEYASLPIDSAP